MIDHDDRRQQRPSRDDDDAIQKDGAGNENRKSARTPSATEEALVKKEDHVPERRDLAKTRGRKFSAK